MQDAPQERSKTQPQDHDNNNRMESHSEQPSPDAPAPQVDSQSTSDANSESPDIVPDSQSVAATIHSGASQQPVASGWNPLDRELAHQKIQEQRKQLKKQTRVIRYLKNEVTVLKRKLQEMQDTQVLVSPEPHPQFHQGFVDQPLPADNRPLLDQQSYQTMDRRTSEGEIPPSKKMRISHNHIDDGSASYPLSEHNSSAEEEPFPLEVEPASTATRVYITREEDHEQMPNTFKVRNQPIVDPYGDRGIYSGSMSCSSALPHGRGRMLYEDGKRIYKGGWNNGQWHGVGEAIFANGDRYNGDYHLDQRHGHGRYGWADGRVYEGDFKADKRHGKGIFYWPDGARYEGDFVNGFREGHGTYIFSGGCKYTGEWKDGRYNGVGSCIWTSGRCYSGEWRNGMRHGKGVETEDDGSVRHDGLWCNDQPVVRETTPTSDSSTPKRRTSKSEMSLFRKASRGEEVDEGLIPV